MRNCILEARSGRLLCKALSVSDPPLAPTNDWDGLCATNLIMDEEHLDPQPRRAFSSNKFNAALPAAERLIIMFLGRAMTPQAPVGQGLRAESRLPHVHLALRAIRLTNHWSSVFAKVSCSCGTALISTLDP